VINLFGFSEETFGARNELGSVEKIASSGDRAIGGCRRVSEVVQTVLPFF
jgi:hypothetical protein